MTAEKSAATDTLRPRRFVPPLGKWKPGARTVTPADRPPLLMFNRYPRQIIGIAIRLPDEDIGGGRFRHKQLSLLWSKPARWWR